MSLNMKDLSAEERAIVDRCTFEFWLSEPRPRERYYLAMQQCEEVILARRALFAPAQPEPKREEMPCPNCKEPIKVSTEHILFMHEIPYPRYTCQPAPSPAPVAGELAEAVEEAAQDAAYLYSKERDNGLFLETAQAFKSGYLAGHAAARAESETEIAAKDQEIAKALAAYDASRAEHDAWEKKLLAEIAELRAKLAAMREPLWMLREEHEAEVAGLQAKLAEAEWRAARWIASGSAEMIDLHKNRGWLFVANTDRLIDDKWFRLMVPPVPLPETEP